MAKRYSCRFSDDPWLKFAVSKDGPAEGPSGERLDVVDTYAKQLETAGELNEANTQAVVAFMKRMKAGRDPKTFHLVLIEAGKLVLQLQKIEKEAGEAGSAPEMKGQYEKARASILKAAENFDISESEIQALDLMLGQADERLALLEAHMQLDKSFSYLKKDGKRIKSEESGLFAVGNEFNVDFGLGDPEVDQAKARAADLTVRLDQIMPAHVTEVTLKPVNGAARVTLIRSGTDQKFREPGKVKEKKWYPVRQGDQVTITATSTVKLQATSPELQSTAAASPELQTDLVKEAETREAAFREDMAEEEVSYLETAVGKSYEEPGKLGPFIYSEIPDSLVKVSDEHFAERLKDMKYGHQMMSSLSVFKDLAGAPSEVNIWNEIRRKRGNRKVYFNEVTRVVMGADASTLRMRYYKVKDELIKEAEAEYKALGGDSMLQKVDNDLIIWRTKLRSRPEDKTIEKRIKQLEHEKTKLERAKSVQAELQAELARMERFYKAAVVFMAVIPHLQDEQGALRDAAVEVPQEVQIIHDICDLLFARRNLGPELKRKKGLLSMQNMGKTDNTYFINTYIMDEAAWVKLSQSALEYGPDGQLKGNLETFLRELNRILMLGYLRAKNDEALRARTGAIDLALLGDDEDSMIPAYDTLESFKAALTTGDQSSRRSTSLRAVMRIGMAVDQSNELAQNENDVAEYQSQLAEGNPAMAAELEVMDAMTTSSLGRPLTLAERKEIADNLKQHYLGTVGLLMNGQNGEWEAGLGADANIPLCKNPPITMHVGFKDNVYSHDFELHAGMGGTVIDRGRFELHLGGGASVGIKEGGINVGTTAGVDIELGKKRIYSLNMNAGVGLNPQSLARGLAMSVGIERDVGMALAARTDEKREANAEGLTATLAGYRETMVPAFMTDVEYKHFENNVYQMMIQELSGEAVKELKPLQFLGAGLSYIPPSPALPMGIVIPYVKLGIKGKPYMVYSRPEDIPNVDDVAQIRLDKEMAQRSGGTQLIEIYSAGTTLIGIDGQRTISIAESRKEELAGARLDRLNETLATQGLHLEVVENKRLKLSVSKVDGAVDIYTDHDSGIQTYTDGTDVFLNLDETDQLHISRVDHYSPARNFGSTHRVEIYVGNNGYLDNAVIRGASETHLHYTESFGKRSDIEYTIDQAPLAEGYADFAREHPETDRRDGVYDQRVLNPTKVGAYASEEALRAAGIELGNFLSTEDLSQRRAIRAEMKKLLGQDHAFAQNEYADAKKHQEFQTWAEDIMKDPKKRRDYKTISTMSVKEANTWLRGILPTTYALRDNNRATTLLLQALMIASLSKTGLMEDVERRNEQVLAWNEQALMKVLAERGITGEQATRITSAIMGHFKEELDANILTPINISAGATVQIQVGTEQIEGYREVDWTKRKDGNLVATIPLEVTDMNEVGITKPEDQAALINAFTGRLAPLDIAKPKEFMHSQLGLAVLDAADLIFSVEEGKKMVNLLELVKESDDPVEIPEHLKASYQQFTQMVLGLRQNGMWENGRVRLSTRTEKAVGLYQQCLNFTAVMKEGLVIQLKVPAAATVVGAEVTEYINGRVGVEIYGGGAAVAMSNQGGPPTVTERGKASEGGDAEHQDQAEEGDTMENEDDELNNPLG